MSLLGTARAAGVAGLLVATLAAGGAAGGPVEGTVVLEVKARDPQAVATLVRDFDLAEFRDGEVYHVVAWPGDETRLRALGFDPQPLPVPAPATSGGFTYRRLADYERELRELADAYPGHVRLLEGREPSLEGRTIYGVEIAGNVAAADGRPVAYIDGVHHAREWPAGEVPMNFARELAEGYGVRRGITDMLDAARVIIVPVVNVDGFHHSRESLVGDQEPTVFGVAAGGQGTYWRKNRRGVAHAHELSVGSYGVDNNRNYSFLWGSTDPSPLAYTSPLIPTQTYHGAAPFSEPETRVVQDLILTNNVTAVISTHTYGGLVLYPWGHTWAPPPDPGMIELAEAMADVNRYNAQPGIWLYPTTGTTDDWAYATTGAYSYTFELLDNGFHPPGGMGLHDQRNRNAFKVLVRWAADPAHHGVLTGTVTDQHGDPITASLRLTKTVATPLSAPYDVLYGPWIETIDRSMTADGAFTWYVNPSGRPLFPNERYTLSVSAPGFADQTLTVSVERGETLDLGQIALSPAG